MDPHDPILAGLTPPQAEAAMHDGATLVLAGAGTGNTCTLTSAVAWRIARHGIPPNRVLAVTFTNKAAAEMTGRIRGMLAGQAVPSWIGTFHGLAARQLRIEPEVAGLRPGFEILDADDSKHMIRRTAAAMHADGNEDAGQDVQALNTLYVALTRGNERVSLTHCAFRRGYVQSARFIDVIPEQHRVTGWLRAQARPGFVRQSGSRFADDLDATELLRQF